MPPISAETFVDWPLDPDKTLDRKPDETVQVDGPLVLRDGSKPIARQRLENFDFKAVVDLSNARFHSGLHIANCSAPALLFTDACISGSLVISGERIAAITLDKATI